MARTHAIHEHLGAKLHQPTQITEPRGEVRAAGRKLQACGDANASRVHARHALGWSRIGVFCVSKTTIGKLDSNEAAQPLPVFVGAKVEPAPDEGAAVGAALRLSCAGTGSVGYVVEYAHCPTRSAKFWMCCEHKSTIHNHSHEHT